MLNPLKSTLSSLWHNQLFLSSASWASYIIQGGSKRGVQRLVNYTCLLIVILIRWREWVMSRERETERKKDAEKQLVLEGLVSHPVLVYPGCTLGSRPCLFIVAGLELILPISFWDRTRCVCLIYLFIQPHIFLYLLSLFFSLLLLLQCSLANEGLHGADKAHPAKDWGHQINQE